MVHTLSVELEAPRVRREAFPWDVADVTMSAILSSNKTTTATTPTTTCSSSAAATATADTAADDAVGADCDRTTSTINVRLPSVVDLSKFWPQGGGKDSTAEGHHRAVREEEQLEVEVLGCDLGVSFTLGTASIPVPTQLKPSIDQNACRSNPFRVCLRDDAGARVGTISGSFLARRGRAIDDPPSTAQHHAAAEQSEAGSAVVLRREAGDDDDVDHRASLLGDTKTSEESAAKHDDREILFENKAIELLDMASKILASANYNSLTHHRGLNPAGSKEMAASDATFEEKNEAMGSQLLPDQHNTQEAGLAENISPANSEDHAYIDAGAPGLRRKDKEREARASRFPTAGFRFEPTTGSVAWHRIAAVNASKVERDGDLQSLKQFIADIAVGQVDEDDIDANPGLIKAFRLAQLQVQYVLHCQQILQRQCGGLQSTTTNMQLEVEGNSQSTTAMKNRVRLLRKESRKQDKIISGYSTMLRRYNPGLASKVRLDEKGRLRVFRVDEAAREWGGGGRRRRRNREQCDIDGLQVLRVKDREKVSQGGSTNGSPTGSSSPPNDTRCHGEDRPMISSTSDHLRAQGPIRSAAGPHVEVPRESNRTNDRERTKGRHQRGGNTDMVGDIQEAFVAEGGDLVYAGGGGSDGIGDNLEPGRRCGGDAGRLSKELTAPCARQDEGGDQTRLPRAPTLQTVEDNRNFDPPKGLRQTPLEIDVPDAGRRSAHDGVKNAGVPANATSQPGKKQLGGSTAPASFSIRGGKDKEGADSPGEGWRGEERDATRDPPVSSRTQSDGNTETGLEVVDATESVLENADNRTGAGLADADDTSGSRAPRLVTVSVKPMRQQQSSPDSAAFNSPHFRGGEDSYAVSPGGGHGSQSSAASGTPHPVGQGGGNNVGGGGEARLTREVPSSANAGVSRGGRPGEAGGEDRQSSVAAESSSFSPSQLGIEGDGYPDALEFDLDDISEIDAGGEWEAEEGEGSSSS